MTRSTVELRTSAGTLTVGNIPRVVGTLSSLDYRGDIPSDIVEVRLDRTGRPSDWLERCKAIQSGGKPVLLTPRLEAEGGAWEKRMIRRAWKYIRRPCGELAAVDVELASTICRKVAEEAARLQKACIVSYHDFQKTPPLADLCALVENAHGDRFDREDFHHDQPGKRCGDPPLAAGTFVAKTTMRDWHGRGMGKNPGRICGARIVPHLRLFGRLRRPWPMARGRIGAPIACGCSCV